MCQGVSTPNHPSRAFPVSGEVVTTTSSSSTCEPLSGQSVVIGGPHLGAVMGGHPKYRAMYHWPEALFEGRRLGGVYVLSRNGTLHAFLTNS